MAFCTTALGVSVYSLWQRSEIGSSLFTGPFKFSVDGGNQLFKNMTQGGVGLHNTLGESSSQGGLDSNWAPLLMNCAASEDTFTMSHLSFPHQLQ